MLKYISLRISENGHLSLLAYSSTVDLAVAIEKKAADYGGSKVRVFRINVIDEDQIDLTERVKRDSYYYTSPERSFIQ
ncbi:hypothetical protein LCGC14_0311040 [marine sediment metagenome]|uniref:Uncharacterized protein n=1 Tax=marine sediment metagenome TaxID=412755 RepID=A0A0F9W9G0_9ZZZZ